ncbi:peptidyl-tRNA hydrolase [Rhodomicrobium udaipurense JA643]|uniref:Peptidyl-tRNA hydrolase n=1 Tax=Rhodomicrobium udaipurense TaxID=1202716 RepID=A0A8I1KKC2_9HYPH|nr:peptidyl-tRNA hydrolase [Rhodomicrobium udaipurense JA643]MBJ7543879.1 aminoacyl-tRNA hydrolase [Rhodomicrobium udaipurense]
MKLIVGLGNPGEKYAGNRHNIGFMAVDEMARGYGFAPWKKRFQGFVAEGQIGLQRCILLKPATYMNESGRAVGEAMRFYKIAIGDVIVIHDEIDLEPGKIRLKTGGGNAGHNGLKSITAYVGNDYRRVRLGVGHPGDKALVANYVLHDFAKADDEWLVPLLEGVARGMSNLVDGKEASFLSEAARGRKPLPKAAEALGSAETAPERVEEPSVEVPLATAVAAVAASAVFEAVAEAPVSADGETAFASVEDAIASLGIETPSLVETSAETEAEATSLASVSEAVPEPEAGAPAVENVAAEEVAAEPQAETPAVEAVAVEEVVISEPVAEGVTSVDDAPVVEFVAADEIPAEPEAEAPAGEAVAHEDIAPEPEAAEPVEADVASEPLAAAPEAEALAAIVAAATKPIEPMPLPPITVSAGRDGSGGAVSSAVMLPHAEAESATETVFDLEREVPPQRVPRDQEILAAREALAEATAPKQAEPELTPVATSGDQEAIAEATGEVEAVSDEAVVAPVLDNTFVDTAVAEAETVDVSIESEAAETPVVQEAVVAAESIAFERAEITVEQEDAGAIEPEPAAEPVQSGTPAPEPAPSPELIIDSVPAPEPQPVPGPEPVGNPDPAPEPAPVANPDPVQEPEPEPLPEQAREPEPVAPAAVAEPARELEFAGAAAAVIERPSAVEEPTAPTSENEPATAPVAKKKGGGFFGWFRRRKDS